VIFVCVVYGLFSQRFKKRIDWKARVFHTSAPYFTGNNAANSHKKQILITINVTKHYSATKLSFIVDKSRSNLCDNSSTALSP